MKNVKYTIAKFYSDYTGNAELFLNFDEEAVRDWPIVNGTIQFQITFRVNGYEWVGTRNRLRNGVSASTLVNEDELSDLLANIQAAINFQFCKDDHGRKRPPVAKQTTMRNEFEGYIVKNVGSVVAAIHEAYDITLSLFSDENPYAAENDSLKKELEAAKAREQKSDIMAIISENVAAAVTPMIEEKIKNRVGSLAGSVPQELIVKIGDTINHCGEAVRHHKFEQVMAAIMVGESCWLKGDAGTGKSYMCEQIAEALGAKYFCTGSIMDEYAGLKGFIDANGIKHGTEFTHALDAMEQGQEVLMVFDEADGSTPEIMLAINNFLSGGVIECMGHAYRMADNMHIVACGNTNGRGGDTKYTRSIIDEATLDRFVFIDIDYDKSIELNVAGGDEQLARFCRELREAAARCGIQLLVTYRAIARMLRLQKVWDSRRDVLLASVIRGMDASDVGVVYRDMQNHHCPDSVWFDELQKMAA